MNLRVCAEHDFMTSDPRRMEAHILTSHPGYLDKVREQLQACDSAKIDAGVSEKGAARQPTTRQLNSIHDTVTQAPPESIWPKEGPVEQVKIDPGSRQAWRGDQEVTLTRSEFEILAEMAKFPTVAISRAQLLNAIGWKGDGFETRTVDAHLYRLRAKLGATLFVAVPGFGYRLGERIEVVERMSYKPDYKPRGEAESMIVCPSCSAPLKGYIDLLRAD